MPLEAFATYLQEYHRKYKGRTEIRERCDVSGRHTIALDVALYCRNKNTAVNELLDQLYTQFNVRRAGMHRGKFQLSSLYPITFMEYYYL